jgi:hypothetical protein
MSYKQLLVFCIVFVGVIASLATLAESLIRKPMDTQAYADKLCQELYGPQVGATWEKGTLMCETVRGEIIEVRKAK